MADSFAIRVMSVLPLGLLTAALLGCAAANPVALDLANYLNQGVLRIAELERKSLESYSSVTGANYRSDREVYEALRDRVVPLYSRFTRELRKIQPETEDVRSLHSIYIRSSASLLEGFRMLMVALEADDAGMIPSVNELLEKGRTENEKWRRELIALSHKYSVKVE